MWEEITCPFPTFNGCIIGNGEWTSSFIPHFIMDVVTCPCCDKSWTVFVKGVAGRWFCQYFPLQVKRYCISTRGNPHAKMSVVVINANYDTLIFGIDKWKIPATLLWHHCIRTAHGMIANCIYMMTSSNIFRFTGPLFGEFTGRWWIPLTKASDAELWCFLWSA